MIHAYFLWKFECNDFYAKKVQITSSEFKALNDILYEIYDIKMLFKHIKMA